jgi:hypothetical protein
VEDALNEDWFGGRREALAMKIRKVLHVGGNKGS